MMQWGKNSAAATAKQSQNTCQYRDRLPLDAVVHCEKYHHYTSSEIDELWAEKETSEETRRLLEENGLPNLAQIFTRNRYRAEDNLAISRNYFALLKKQGFFNN